ncbi:hypothetical protein GOC13_07335 [Sinorhizobium meliloti]|nr:hypothetical protein [Sinorhizobium meliloti]
MSYFSKDCKVIAENALTDLDVFKNVGSLVLLSIRQPWIVMPQQMADVWDKGRESKYLFGHKRLGFDFIQAHASRLQRLARECKDSGDLDSYVLALLECPNLGIVKASFFAQMTVADGACLDSHNLKRLGLAETFFRLPKTLKLDSVHKRIRAYNAVWRTEGDSAYWWNTWCDHLAKQTRNAFDSGAQVSAYHRLALRESPIGI